MSGLVHKHYGYDNVGFHMGTEEVTIDFNGVLTQKQLEALEDEANEIIYANVPVKALYPESKELDALDYRSKKELTGQVRIVEIPGADVCACCGTHVENTGEVGIIKTRTMIHYKGGVRISMLCGRLALLDYRERLKDEIRISNLLSAKVALVPEAVEKLKNEGQHKDGQIGEMWQKIFRLKLAVCPESQGAEEFFEEGMEPMQLRQFATLLYEQNKGKIAGVFSGNDSDGIYQYALGSSQADMRALSKAMNARLDGRGGGSALMAQGTLKEQESRSALFSWKKRENYKEKEIRMEFNRDTINKIRGLILFTVVTVIVGINYTRVLELLASAVHMAAPFILGAVIAFILNVPMRWIETSLDRVFKKNSRLKRPLSLIASILFVAGVLFLVMFVVMPQLVRTLWSLQNSIPRIFLWRSGNSWNGFLRKILRY